MSPESAADVWERLWSDDEADLPTLGEAVLADLLLTHGEWRGNTWADVITAEATAELRTMLETRERDRHAKQLDTLTTPRRRGGAGSSFGRARRR